MAKSPSKRNHRQRPLEGLNLTPFIDMITCIMFFLLMFAGIIPVVIIDAPLPKIASTADEVKKAKEDEKKLELTVVINENGFDVKTGGLGDKKFAMSADGKYPYEELRKFLVDVHVKKPDSREITLVPADSTTYEVMINVMDSSRELKQGDAGFQQIPPDIAQKPESLQFNRLFPDVSIGGV